MTQQRPNRAQRRQQPAAGGPAERIPSGLDVPDTAEIRYVRSNLSRVIRVDGGFGGPTAHGNIHLAIYVDRTDTPDLSLLHLNKADQTVREEIPQRTMGWTREIESDLILSLDTARSIRDWLDRTIKQVEVIGERATFKNVTFETQ